MTGSERRHTLRAIVLTLFTGFLAGSILFGGLGGGNSATACVDDAALSELVAGNTTFALNLYQALRSRPGNLFLSPYSISSALAMTYAGARGETAAQMRSTLHFTLPKGSLHLTFHALDSILTGRTGGSALQLNLANAIWGQSGYPFTPEYLALLADAYVAEVERADFAADPETARAKINDWVLRKTNAKIEELLAPGIVTTDARLVLGNAIYFYGMWKTPFEKDKTILAPSYLLDGKQVLVPMMQRKALYRYTEGPDYQAIELPYNGETLAMLILLPRPGSFEAFEAGLNAAWLTMILDALNPQEVTLSLPRFELDAEFSLADTLATLGMPAAFQPALADFSGMDGTRNLSIDFVVHKAFVSVSEEGTEAAAATGVGMRLTLATTMNVEHPFLFLIRDVATGTILFIGRVVDPTAG
jgi:serpin B